MTNVLYLFCLMYMQNLLKKFMNYKILNIAYYINRGIKHRGARRPTLPFKYCMNGLTIIIGNIGLV